MLQSTYVMMLISDVSANMEASLCDFLEWKKTETQVSDSPFV